MDNQDNNQYSVKVKKSEPLLKNSKSELSDIIEMIVKMAYETEEKKLNKELVEKAIEKLLKYPIYGQYFFIIDSLLDKFCGMNLVTFEHNINLDTTILWIQSVFVHEDYRMKGLFRRLLYKNEDYVLENKGFKKTVKLYMDKDNEKAEKVYFKVGFKVCKEILYELDFHFDDISELKNSNKENSENETNKSFVKINILGVKHTDDKNDLNLHGGIFTDEFYKYVLNVNEINNPEINEIFGNGNNNKNRAIHFESLINGNKIDIQEEKEKLMKVISNRNLGMILVISNEENTTVYGFVYIFYEISDWRNSYFWWLYDIYVKAEYKDFIQTHIEEVIFKVVKLNYDLSGCGVRAIVNENSEELIQKTILEKSNYIIYEKEL